MVNIFSIINESTLTIIGFYLFFFIDGGTTQSFYGWLVIAIVVLMVSWNVLFIFFIKFRDLFSQIQEIRRLNRLKLISSIEQKYLYFDYRKFFLSSLSQQVKFHKEEIVRG